MLASVFSSSLEKQTSQQSCQSLTESPRRRKIYFFLRERKKEQKEQKVCGSPASQVWWMRRERFLVTPSHRWNPSRRSIPMNSYPSHTAEDMNETPTISSVEAQLAAGQTVNVNAWLNERKKRASGGGVTMSRAAVKARGLFMSNKRSRSLAPNDCGCIFCCGAAGGKRSGSKGSGHMVAELTTLDWMRNEGFILFHLIWCFLTSVSESRVSGSFFFFMENWRYWLYMKACYSYSSTSAQNSTYNSSQSFIYFFISLPLFLFFNNFWPFHLCSRSYSERCCRQSFSFFF